MRKAWRKKLAWLVLVVAAVTLYRHLTFKEMLTVSLPGEDEPQQLQVERNVSGATTKRASRDVVLGYELAKRINKKCNVTQYPISQRVFGNYESNGIQTCIIWKIGTTFIKRLYMIKKLSKFKGLINPYDIDFNMPYKPISQSISNERSKSRFLFVRDPYNRLLSGYVDKLLAPNPIYWKLIGVPAIRMTRSKPSSQSVSCGHDLTFSEYVKYIIKAMDPKIRGAHTDGHFDRMTTLCKPCSVKYDFVGRMSSFGADSLELARRLEFSNQTIDLLMKDGGRFASLDAIKDTVHQPFDETFKKGYTSCISFKEALTRSWNKLQIRGLIGNTPFPVKDNEINLLKEERFLDMAIRVRDGSSLDERKKLQKSHFKKFYSTVSEPDIEHIKRIYQDDFGLFEYSDESPANQL